MFESFDNFGGSRRFVNFPNFNSLAILEAESNSILRDPLDTRDPFLTFNCEKMKWPLLDRAGIEEENFLKCVLKRRIS
jgi:hypothetical protein